MLAAGFHEAIASTFCSATEAAVTAPQPGLVVPLGNPLSEEAGVLRPSLVPGMLTAAAGNLQRDDSDVRLFELGTVFSGTTDKVEERPSLAFTAAGTLPEQGALHPARPIDFHDIKGVVEQLLARFQSRVVYFDRFPPDAGLTPAWLHPYRSARVVVEGVTAGWFGQLHPGEAATRKLKEPVLIGEIYIDRLYKLPLRKPVAREISRASSPFAAIFLSFSMRASRGKKSITPLHRCRFPSSSSGARAEVFRDKRLGAREVLAPARRQTVQAPDRTLREEELQSFQAQVIEAVSCAGARSSRVTRAPPSHSLDTCIRSTGEAELYLHEWSSAQARRLNYSCRRHYFRARSSGRSTEAAI